MCIKGIAEQKQDPYAQIPDLVYSGFYCIICCPNNGQSLARSNPYDAIESMLNWEQYVIAVYSNYFAALIYSYVRWGFPRNRGDSEAKQGKGPPDY